ncbi:MAG: cytochrome C oxidase subunit IV family protein [Pseudomonadota bacterium]
MQEIKSSRPIDDATLAWVLLLAGTGLAWWLGQADRASEQAGAIATARVIFVAFVKVWIVGFQFMELRHAPRWLRHAFDAWIVVMCVALVTICIY